MYLGYYHCDFVSRAGPRFYNQIDFLPEFINFRIHTDVVHDTHEIGNQKKEPNVYANWFFFALDWVAGALTCGGVHHRRHRRAYCETCSRWMLSKKAIAAAGFAGKVAAAISAEADCRFACSARSPEKERPSKWPSSTSYCPGNKDQTDVCPIYLTAREVIPGNNKRVTVTHQVPLTVEELPNLAQKLTFPEIAYFQELANARTNRFDLLRQPSLHGPTHLDQPAPSD